MPRLPHHWPMSLGVSSDEDQKARRAVNRLSVARSPASRTRLFQLLNRSLDVSCPESSLTKPITRSRVCSTEPDCSVKRLKGLRPSTLPSLDLAEQIMRVRACRIDLNKPSNDLSCTPEPPGFETPEGFELQFFERVCPHCVPGLRLGGWRWLPSPYRALP